MRALRQLRRVFSSVLLLACLLLSACPGGSEWEPGHRESAAESASFEAAAGPAGKRELSQEDSLYHRFELELGRPILPSASDGWKAPGRAAAGGPDAAASTPSIDALWARIRAGELHLVGMAHTTLTDITPAGGQDPPLCTVVCTRALEPGSSRPDWEASRNDSSIQAFDAAGAYLDGIYGIDQAVSISYLKSDAAYLTCVELLDGARLYTYLDAAGKFSLLLYLDAHAAANLLGVRDIGLPGRSSMQFQLEGRFPMHAELGFGTTLYELEDCTFSNGARPGSLDQGYFELILSASHEPEVSFYRLLLPGDVYPEQDAAAKNKRYRHQLYPELREN